MGMFQLSISQIQEALDECKFLNFTFSVDSGHTMDRPDWLSFVTTYKVLNTQSREEVISITHINESQYRFNCKEQVYVFAFQSVLCVLGHEASELFTVNGKDVYNEHEHPKGLGQCLPYMIGGEVEDAFRVAGFQAQNHGIDLSILPNTKIKPRLNFNPTNVRPY